MLVGLDTKIIQQQSTDNIELILIYIISNLALGLCEAHPFG